MYYESTNEANITNENPKKINNPSNFHTDVNLNKDSETNDPNMIKIKFVVNKDEWKKKKRIISLSIYLTYFQI